ATLCLRGVFWFAFISRAQLYTEDTRQYAPLADNASRMSRSASENRAPAGPQERSLRGNASAEFLHCCGLNTCHEYLSRAGNSLCRVTRSSPDIPAESASR